MMTFSILILVASLTYQIELVALDTVCDTTPAFNATSSILGIFTPIWLLYINFVEMFP